ncbi:MAG: hypothetical protein R2776_05880 [Flavobacteriaceae bacterium]
MKTKGILFFAVLAISLTSKMKAQDPCVTTASLFIEPAKAKNYEAALPNYQKVITDCPQYSLATYQYAVKMFEYFIEKRRQEQD